MTEPEFKQRYLLYLPSSYDRNMAWPLVVVCAAGFPDSPDQQIRNWTQIAERQGFLVCAPQTRGHSEKLFADPAKATAVLQDDERRILAAIRHVQAAHTISEDRVFVYGWGSGARPAVYAGLRHPELFRAIAVTQPSLEVKSVAEVGRNADPHQPVLVYSNATDAIWGHPANECAAWLQSMGAEVRHDTMGPARRTDTNRVADFFDQSTRTRPWIRVIASSADPARPAEYHFGVRASFKPSKLRWRFGDGDEATVAEPIHTYSQSGSYHVTVELLDSQGKVHERATEVHVRASPGG